MDKKLNSLDALASIKFENLAPDPEPTTEDHTSQFIKQSLEAHFSNKGRARKSSI